MKIGPVKNSASAAGMLWSLMATKKHRVASHHSMPRSAWCRLNTAARATGARKRTRLNSARNKHCMQVRRKTTINTGMIAVISLATASLSGTTCIASVMKAMPTSACRSRPAVAVLKLRRPRPSRD